MLPLVARDRDDGNLCGHELLSGGSKMARVPYVNREDLTPEHQAAYDRIATTRGVSLANKARNTWPWFYK